jgi:hypothetical protein
MSQEHEVRYWTQALGVSESQLRSAVESVGSSADKVRAFLSGQGAGSGQGQGQGQGQSQDQGRGQGARSGR